MKFLMMSTCIMNDENLSDLLSMIESCKNQKISYSLVILLQGDKDGYHKEISRIKLDCFVIYSKEIISLSRARNQLLKYSVESGLFEHCDLVTFPDDDCWYPDNCLSSISRKFEENADLDLLVCRYANDTTQLNSKNIKKLSVKELISFGSSVTLFSRKKLVDTNHFFDESLGIGSPNNGGEDLDFSLRAYSKARESIFINSALVGHQDKDNSTKHRYFQGAFKALRKNATLHPMYAFYLIRKLLVGIYYVVKYKMPIRMFISAR